MKKIKEFFEKKQNDLKFKTAGVGHKLSDAGKPSASSSSQNKTSASNVYSNVSRTGPDSKVANAALARFGDKTSASKPVSKPTLHDIMTEEKKKATEEMKLKDEVKALKQKQASVQEQVNPFKEFEDKQEFTCTALEINSPLPFNELMCKIKAKIFDNFADDAILRSAMCLFNCNRTIEQDQTKLESCLNILKKVVTNLQTKNQEEFAKFKRIRKSKIEQKVLSLDGALDFLYAIGFTNDSEPDWLVYAEEDEDLFKKMQYVYELLDVPQIIPIELDRKLRYVTEEVVQDSNEDLSMTSTDFKRFYSDLERNREINEMFISKETKAKMLSNSSSFKPIFAKLKFKLSLTENEIETVEAVFYSTEKLSDVKNWLVSTFSPLFDEKNVQFKVGLDLFSNDSFSKSLTDLKLTPAATLLVIAK